ncbi:MAG: hypothetical protein ACFFB3_09245 [Candidatus Hodarchaeota archaeon]
MARGVVSKDKNESKTHGVVTPFPKILPVTALFRVPRLRTKPNFNRGRLVMKTERGATRRTIPPPPCEVWANTFPVSGTEHCDACGDQDPYALDDSEAPSPPARRASLVAEAGSP